MNSTSERLGPNWDDIQIFLAIARARSLTGAAPKLNLSQPTLGRRLRVLEQRVGSPLFVRASDGLTLTIDGQAILSDAEMMEQAALAFGRRLSNESQEPCGLLRIASREWLLRHVLGKPLSTFARSNPEIILALLQDDNRNDSGSRDTDLTFKFTLSGLQAFTEPDVVQRRVTGIHYDLFASSEYLSEHGGWPTKGCGSGHQSITDASQPRDGGFEQRWFQHHFPKVRTSVQCGYIDAQALACRQGAGVTLLPTPVGESYLLERLGMKDLLPNGGIWLGYHRDLRPLKRLRDVVSYMVNALPREL